jgi:hypothetical protein
MFIFEPASRLRTGSAGKATRSTRRTKAHENAGHLRIKKAFHPPAASRNARGFIQGVATEPNLFMFRR